MNMTREKLEKEFEKWKKDDSALKEYEQFNPAQDMVLIRLFWYKKDAPKSLILETGQGQDLSNELLLRATPYAKVLKEYRSANTGLKLEAGDIITVADDVTRQRINPEWKSHMELMKERPAPIATDIPPMYIGVLGGPAWQQFLFVKDKLMMDMTIDDAHTFLVPAPYIKTIVK